MYFAWHLSLEAPKHAGQTYPILSCFSVRFPMLLSLGNLMVGRVRTGTRCQITTYLIYVIPYCKQQKYQNKTDQVAYEVETRICSVVAVTVLVWGADAILY